MIPSTKVKDRRGFKVLCDGAREAVVSLAAEVAEGDVQRKDVFAPTSRDTP